MIRQITDASVLNSDREILLKSYYGRKLLAYLEAYGTQYDFCRFYELVYENTRAYMFQINSAALVCAYEEFPPDELITYIGMYRPFRVEIPQFMLDKINVVEGYGKLKRTQFQLNDVPPDNFAEDEILENPKLDHVFEILHEGFPTIDHYGLWMTENSHRVRRGSSKIYLYRNCTTATVIFDVDNYVLIGQVATKMEHRGKNYARELLHWLGAKLAKEGKTAVLFALDYRESYYREIGFKEIGIESVLQQIEQD